MLIKFFNRVDCLNCLHIKNRLKIIKKDSDIIEEFSIPHNVTLIKNQYYYSDTNHWLKNFTSNEIIEITKHDIHTFPTLLVYENPYASFYLQGVEACNVWIDCIIECEKELLQKN